MDKLKNLWVVDDDEVYRFAIKIVIDRSGIAEHTFYFNNGQTAIDAFVEKLAVPDQLPDLILLDLNMPILDGWQFLDVVTRLLPTVPKKVNIFVVSSSNDEEDFDKARSIHAVQDLIVKPLTPRVLQDILSRIQEKQLTS